MRPARAFGSRGAYSIGSRPGGAPTARMVNDSRAYPLRRDYAGVVFRNQVVLTQSLTLAPDRSLLCVRFVETILYESQRVRHRRRQRYIKISVRNLRKHALCLALRHAYPGHLRVLCGIPLTPELADSDVETSSLAVRAPEEWALV
jgi:hypothetical protein